MSKLYSALSIAAILCCCVPVFAQTDSTLEALQQVPDKYVKNINTKIDKYTSSVSKKTIKTLTKLAKWETKIKSTLDKLSPETSQRLFSNNQLTFASLLQKIQQGEATGLEYAKQYDKYRDELTTNVMYLEKEKNNLAGKVAMKVSVAKQKVKQLNEAADSSEAIQQFIRERKKQLIDGAIHIIGKNKYLAKINKEVFYHSETLANYKAILSDSKKTEQAVAAALNSIPAFKNFFQQNSMLAALFGGGRAGGSSPSLEGMQTRNEMASLLQNQVAAGGAGAASALQQNLQAAQGELNNIKSKMSSLGASGGDVDDRVGKFKPNGQKSKTFLQRIETGFNFQSLGGSAYFPATTDIGFTAAYKLNDKASIGIGSSYKLGWGSSIANVKFTTQGIGFRSFAEYKIKGNFYAGGGFEYNYQPSDIEQYGKDKTNNWHQSGLAGISKILSTKTKFYKKTKVQLFWDFLSYRQLPRSSPLKFRIGYVL